MKVLTSPTRRIVAINFFMMFAVQSVYFIGIIGCATYVLSAGALEVSALVFLMNMAIVLGNLGGGPVIDRVGPRRTLLVSLAALSAMGFAAWLIPVSYPVLALASLAIGLFFGAGTTAIDAYPRFFTEDAGHLARMNGLNQMATGASVIVGPALAGWIATWAPHQCVFALEAFAPIGALAVTYVTREELAKPVSEKGCDAAAEGAGAGGKAGRFMHELAEGARIVFGRKELRVLLVIGFLGLFAYGAFDSLESLFYRDVLRVGSDWMGWLSSISGIGGTAGSLLVLKIPKKRFSTWLLAASLLVLGVGSMIYTGTNIAPVAAVGQLVCGVGYGALAPIRTTLMQQRCDPSNVGRVASLMRVGMNSAGTIPLLFAPALADAFGVQAVLFGASVMAAAVGAFFMFRFRRES
ncbi:MAG: MFS transporter [Coriobacteriia bacterium]|nr:MFS transporter [Coriobacteriia bacterium]